jgi:glycosyltransferase involved in cell wall biosynthesis
MSKSFSIIIPTYNRADRIAGTIQSVLNQNYTNFEILVIDDGSTDNTKDIVASIQDLRIRYLRKKNEERAIARNFGVEQATGDYVTFLDSDDSLYAHFLDEALSIIKQYNHPEWFHIAYEIKDETGKVIRKENKRHGQINRTLISGNHLSCIGVFVRKDILEKHQFNEDPAIIGSEDYLLWLELASRFPLGYSNKISACLMQHQSRSVINFDQNQLIARIVKSIEIVSRDQTIRKFLNRAWPQFTAHRYLYLANHLSRASYKLHSLKYYLISIRNFPLIAFQRNSFSYLKSLFIL